jgi:hypothetical protein
MSKKLKQIKVTIPEESILPEELVDFSPEENFIMIKIGCQCLLEGRNAVAGLTQEEIYNKIKDENRSITEKMELEILVEREIGKKMGEKITQMYEGQIDQLKKKIESTMEQLKIYEYENEPKIQERIQNEVEKAREKYELLLKEKDEQNRLNREVFDKAVNMNKYTSSSKKGEEGEDIFESLSETFKDFTGYKIENMAKQGHKGDFHLFFDEFNVLVDSKNYSSSVQKKEVVKIESDLTTNDNMNYAWLVSLDSDIAGWNRFPIMNKWIMTDKGMKCIIFINNLLKNPEPKNILRMAWTICNEFNKLITKAYKEDGELTQYKELNLLISKQINSLQERTSEMRRNMNASSNMLKKMDEELLEILSMLSNKIIIEHLDKYKKVEEWFDINIEYTNNLESDKILSTDVWCKFKKDMKDYVAENKFTIELFKESLKRMLNVSNYNEKSKGGALELLGYKFKEVEKKDIVIENLVLDFEKKSDKKKSGEKKPKIEKMKVEKVKMEKVKVEKVKVEKVKVEKFKDYFNKEKDNEIIEYYKDENNNIMSISELCNIRPWQVVSLLIRNKIISKRDESRGYDIYKQTDEYKSKIIK